MSSVLKTERDCIEHMARLSGRDWQGMTTNVSWHVRRSELTADVLPKKYKVIHDQILDPEEWRRIRLEVARVRRALYRQRVKEKRASTIERRRDYMRAYMSKYRSQL